MEIREILDKMTLEEKIALGSGKDFWHLKEFEQYGIPSVMVTDGPHGLRKQAGESDMIGLNDSVPATCFPTASLSACSFNEELMERVGEALGREGLANDVAVVLGPGANIKRDPLCGRNFEYFSEDPVLSGKMAAAEIRGIEKTGCGSSLKHYALNNQETKRFSSDSVADERTMREIYLKSFEIAVKEGKPSTVMCSYNRVNGTHSSDNRWLLTDVLRKDWGFDGVVVTDWGAMYDRIDGYKAGCDLSMPGGSAYMEKEVAEAVKNGSLSEEFINASAERVLKLILVERQQVQADLESHYRLAYEMAADSFVLLKNENGILPLSSDEKVLFVGQMAEEMRYQGAGSSHINPYRLANAKDFIGGYDYLPGCDSSGDTTQELLDQLKAAENYDKVVVFAGLVNRDESEGFDRSHMRMSEGHLAMIGEVLKHNDNVAVVLIAGSAVELPFHDEVKALLFAGLSGEAGAEALVDVLFGKVNPSGHLAETWPVQYSDSVTSEHFGEKNPVYREGVYVGYRYYQKAGKEVRFPFGHGLSYTDFELSDLLVDGKTVRCSVTNTGSLKGSAVVQLYVRPEQENCYREVRGLKHFRKVALEPGQTSQVTFELTDGDFTVFGADGWMKAGGSYAVELGFSSEDLRLSQTVGIGGDAFDPEVPAWYRAPSGYPSTGDYEKILGREVKEEKLVKGQFTMNNTLTELKDYSFVMKMVFKGMEGTIAKQCGGKADYNDGTFRMMMESAAGSSLAAMHNNSCMDSTLFEGLLEMANGHFFKGVKKIIGG